MHIKKSTFFSLLFFVVNIFGGSGNIYAQTQGSQILLTKESNSLYSVSENSLEKTNLMARLGSEGVTRKMAIETTMKHQKWAIDKVSSGLIHTIDRVYGDVKKDQYASIAISESKLGNGAGALVGMAVFVPQSVDVKSGMFIAFCKSVENGKELVSNCKKELKFVASYSKCEKENNMCTVMFKDMKITQENGLSSMDIKSAVLENDDIVLGFLEPDGPHLVLISLLGFQAAYK